jgi:hypothetical protein
MGLSTRANDWQVCGLVSLAGGAGAGAGLCIFDFYSATAGVSARFGFKGGGLGVGGNAGGTTLGQDVGPFTAWSDIEAVNPFSVWDLNGAWGRLASFGGGIGLGYGIVAITAAPPWAWSGNRAFFVSQSVGGLGFGVGASGVLLVGNWRFRRVTHNTPGDSYETAA